MVVALRAVTLGCDGEGLAKSALREMKLHSQLRHPNVVRLLEIVKDKHSDLAANYTSSSGQPCCLLFLVLLIQLLLLALLLLNLLGSPTLVGCLKLYGLLYFF